MDDPFSDQSSSGSQLTFDAVEFVCPACHETPEATEERGNTILLGQCGHAFRRDDLIAVIEHLRVLDDLIQRHDAATTPLERQRIREEIYAVGTKLDADAEQCKAQRDHSRMG